MNISDLKLCLLTHPQNQSFSQYRPFLSAVIKGGVTSVQYRDKTSRPAERYRFAQALRDELACHHIPLIINDDLKLALSVEADGLHLGQTDGAPQMAREKLPQGAYIGLSIESMDELSEANRCTDINYVAASAIFPTHTKTNCRTYWGLSGLSAFVQASTHPVVAIGGIDLSQAGAIMQQGVAGVAVISALHNATDPKKATQSFIQLLSKAKHD